MKYLEILNKFKENKIKYFSLDNFQKITGLSYDASRAILQRYKKKELVVNPKKGFYFFKDYAPSVYEIANKIYFPSYISMETVLSKKGIIPETVYSIISVTSKSTRIFVFQNIKYRYHKIKQSGYTGYYKDENYLVADKEKAVADYLYFVALGLKQLNQRLNLKNIDKKKLRKYGEMFENSKLMDLINKYA